MLKSPNFWLKLLPDFVRAKIENREGVISIINNSWWLFADKIVRMGVGLFVGVWIARYLGPQDFGLWNYAIAFSSLFAVLSGLGLDAIVVRELVKNPNKKNSLLGTAFVLKFIAALITLLLALLLASLARDESQVIWLVGLSSFGFVFQSINVIDFYFQSRVTSKYTVFATNLAFLIITVIKVILVLNSAQLIFFAWAALGEAVLSAFFLLVAYKANFNSFSEWIFDLGLAKKLLNDGWPLIFSGLAVMIYMKIDQIMIGQMLGDRAVGVYTSATRLSEVWYFIPMSIVASAFPSLIESKKYNNKLYLDKFKKLYHFMVIVSLLISIPMTFLSDFLILGLYGSSYSDAGGVLSIHIWTSVFVFLGVASGKWFVIENKQMLSFQRAAAGAFTNVFLNILFIPKFGIIGAAYATLISQAVAALFFDLFHRFTRPMFFMKLAAINPFFLIFRGK